MGVHVASTVFRFIFFLLQFFIFQTFHLLAAAAVLQSSMERRLLRDDSGFISLCCGLAAGSYNYYAKNGLNYTSDEKYISSGNKSKISPAYYSSLSNYAGQELFATLRSFPEGRRNCYHLWPLKPNNKYLVRPKFMYGNYDGKNSFPAFDVYIGVNFWFTLSLHSAYGRYFGEIIHVATSESIDVCLVNTGQGTPFISVLELRPLEITSPYPASPAFSLFSLPNEDVGGFSTTPWISEVMDDPYDREWYRDEWSDWKVINNTNGTFDSSEANNPCKVPTSVLMTAGEQKHGLPNLTEQYTVDDPIAQVYVYWHFAELELLGSNDTREFNLFVSTNGPVYKFGPIRPKYMQVTTIASPRISLNGSGYLYYTLKKTNESNHYPILNAIEVYKVLDLPASPTNQEDVDGVTAIKDNYVIPKIWQGDPCLPIDYQWDGLNCTYDDNNPPRITSLNLSSSNLTGELPPSLSNLTSLKYLNFSNNGLTGTIPEFLANMPSLNVIDLTGNNLMGPVPPLLAEKAHNKSIDLRLEGNPDVCILYPCEEKMEVSKKRRRLIIPLIVACVALVSVSLIIGIIFLAFKRRKKPEGLVDRAIKRKNKQFNSSEIVRITDSFRKVVGKGGFGTVYYGVLQDDTEVAVKVLNNTSSTISVKQFCAEAELLTRIHHVNLVSLIGYCDEHTSMALVYEYMPCGNSQMHLSESNEHPLSWEARLQISIDVAQGLEYLHCGCRPPIIHRDVKPPNILLDETGHAKIADFGLSRFFTTNSQGAAVLTELAGTRGYLDPEYAQLINTLSEKSDVYAFGIVLLQLLTGKSALIKDANDECVPIGIVEWVSPIIESGDILAIVDKRLQGNMNVNSAWKFLEIAMECVKPTGNERPRMSEVVADLKVCYESEGFREQIADVGVDSGNGNYYMNSSQALDDSCLMSLPSAR